MEQLLMDDYNFYRERTYHFQKLRTEKPYIRLPKLNPARKKMLTELVAWCRANSLDPRYWLYCLFARNRWLFAPKWTAGALMSKTGLQWYRAKAKQVDTRLYYERVGQTRENQAQESGSSAVYDPNVHLSAEVEARKQRLLQRGETVQCMSLTNDLRDATLGYHPKSRVCGQCPTAPACATQLRGMFPFDIVALREGKITVQQATLAAAVNRGRS